MTAAEIDRFIEWIIPGDRSEETKERFRDLQKNPSEEGNAAEVTIEEAGSEQSLFYEFDFGDGWKHHIELQEMRDGLPESQPIVIDE